MSFLNSHVLVKREQELYMIDKAWAADVYRTYKRESKILNDIKELLNEVEQDMRNY